MFDRHKLQVVNRVKEPNEYVDHPTEPTLSSPQIDNNDLRAYPRAAKTYALSCENFLIAGSSAMVCPFGGRRVRMRTLPMTSNPATMPALARTEFPKPSDVYSVLLSMMGWMMDPKDEPVATMAMARTRRRWKYWLMMAMEGM